MVPVPFQAPALVSKFCTVALLVPISGLGASLDWKATCRATATPKQPVRLESRLPKLPVLALAVTQGGNRWRVTQANDGANSNGERPPQSLLKKKRFSRAGACRIVPRRIEERQSATSKALPWP